MKKITTCLVSENSGLAVRKYHAPESISIPIYYDYRSHGQGTGRQTHPNHEEHVEAVERGREYLKKLVSDETEQQMASYGDQLCNKEYYVSMLRLARRSPRRTPMSKAPESLPSLPCVAPAADTTRVG
jgi:hypothetical protein